MSQTEDQKPTGGAGWTKKKSNKIVLVSSDSYSGSVTLFALLVSSDFRITNARIMGPTCIGLSKLDFPEAKDEQHELLENYHHIFSLPGDRIESTDVLTHNIPIEPSVPPIYVPSYRAPHAQRAVLDQSVKDVRL